MFVAPGGPMALVGDGLRQGGGQTAEQGTG